MAVGYYRFRTQKEDRWVWTESLVKYPELHKLIRSFPVLTVQKNEYEISPTWRHQVVWGLLCEEAICDFEVPTDEIDEFKAVMNEILDPYRLVCGMITKTSAMFYFTGKFDFGWKSLACTPSGPFILEREFVQFFAESLYSSP